MNIEKMSTGKIIVLAIIALIVFRKIDKAIKAPSKEDQAAGNVPGAGAVIGIGGATAQDITRAKAEVARFAEFAAKNKQHPSFKNATVAAQANALHTAMKGVGVGLTVARNTIKSQKNDRDFERLFVAFGVRESQSLSGWVQSEWVGPVPLSSILNSILKDNSIKYRFV